MRSFKYCIFLILLSGFFELSFAKLPTCSESGCPTNGVWGEWKTVTGSDSCDMACGGCGVLYQTRDCISSPVCNCIGLSYRYSGCNMQACKYPTQKTCCAPYVPMVLNGTQMCGPLPKSLDNNACCPKQSLLSQWSGYRLVNSQWTRTRKCLTASIGCPCTELLVETVAKCPCGQPSNATNKCNNLALAAPLYYRILNVNDKTGEANLVMIGQTQGDKIYCKALTDDYGSTNGYQGAMLIMEEVSGKCTTDTVFDCAHGVDDDKRQLATFTCDPTTMKWIYDYTGKQVNGIVQGVWR